MSTSVLLLVLLGCNGSGDVEFLVTPGPETSTGGTTAVTTTTDSTSNEGVGGPPAGLVLDSVTFNQSVEAIMMFGGEPVDPEVPLVAGRPAWVRAFLDVDESTWEARDIVGRLTVTTAGDEVVYEDTSNIRGDSERDTKRTTLNFEIDADMLKRNASYELAVYEADPSLGDGKRKDTTWSSDDVNILVDKTDTVELVILPIQYDADGSGRLPDTSQSQVNRIADLFYAMYPVEDVIVTVADPAPWPYALRADGSGWETLLAAVSDLRTSSGEADNVYYYGLFTPEDRFNDFCSRGCVLGLSYVGYSARDVWARSSIGVGWTGDTTSETLVHEVGHAHGREHAPCGVYDVDRNYPHRNGEIAVWGYDLITKEMFPPSTKDMMGYCSPIWISDYTYMALFSRIRELGPSGIAPMTETLWPSFTVDAEGEATQRGRDVPVRAGLPGGEAVDVELLNGAGGVIEVKRGYVLPYGHLPGGRLVVDVSDDVVGVRLVDPTIVQREPVLYFPG
jgi:hypothetical protein